MTYHVVIQLSKPPSWEAKFDLSAERLETRILAPYRALNPIVIGGLTILPDHIERIQIIETSQDSTQFRELVTTLARQGTREWYLGEPGAKDVTDVFVTTPSLPTRARGLDAVERLCSRFHLVAMQLRKRRQNRPTLDVSDEYDVQDLMHALLHVFFDDIRPEEWTPNYAGGSSRMDFLLPLEQTVIETKRSRSGLNARSLGNDLIEDIARYRVHPECKQLVCFVYDPEGHISNPRGLERDLTRDEQGFRVKVLIFPRPF